MVGEESMNAGEDSLLARRGGRERTDCLPTIDV